MEIVQYNPDNVPSFARHSSTFKNDDRCYEVDFVVGGKYDEVLKETLRLAKVEGIVDYDINYSSEGDCYVGVTCKDYDEQTS